MKRPLFLAALAALAVATAPTAALAYVGPGAGFAVVATAMVLVLSIFALIVGVLLYPFRMVWRLFTRKRPPRPARIRRAVVLGLDGLDPVITRRLMNEGRLPNMKRLADKGGFWPLGTTTPAMSPVAWSSFATGVDPSKHGVFDFITRDPRSYLPVLSSAEVGPPRRHLDIGPYRFPLGKPELRLLRKSKSFWTHLGQYRIPANVLRVPITFPPERFEGNLLSAMCVPDMLGTQGSFTFFTSRPEEDKPVGGRRVAITVDGDTVTASLEGPPNPLRRDGQKVSLPLSLRLDRAAGKATLQVAGKRFVLAPGDYTDWVPLAFPMGLGFKVRGIARFRLTELGEHVGLYVTPMNIDPASPALPISHPFLFSVFLAKLNGSFATLGLAEDTWARNEDVLDDDGFLQQAWDIHEERERMFFQMLRRTPRGLLACVFDGSDRIQHMFMRYEDEDHPALRGKARDEAGAGAIGALYERMDRLVGKTMAEVDIEDPRNLFLVLSDHGFKSFRRGINLNKWLHDEGYLVLEEGRERSGEWLRGVDWSKTRAFAVGLGGIFLNVQGRESQGVVPGGEAARALVDEIAGKLRGLVDPADGQVAIREVYTTHSLYDGPYADEAPDLFVGYEAGWRMSWDGARGLVDGAVFTDNTKAWSGDHCIDPKVVPGILLSNHRLGDAERLPDITDVAPTILDLFGIPTPRYMDGRSLAEVTK